jgi:L-ascorbate metabolism protein UlaG (beta-lactamase superfamily)
MASGGISQDVHPKSIGERSLKSLRSSRGILLLLVTVMLWLHRNGFQPVNIILVIFGTVWLAHKGLTTTSLFRKNETVGEKTTLRRKAKIMSLLIVGFIVFILISATLFINISPQVGGDSLDYDSLNYRDGAFQNLIATDVSSENSSFWETMAAYMVSGEQRSPGTPLPTKEFILEPLESEEISVTWFGHSTLLIRSNEVTILTDPLFGEDNIDPLFFGPSPFSLEFSYELEDLPPIDYVLISHDHYDHLDMGAIKELRESTFFVPLGIKAHLLRWNVPGENVQELDWYDEVNVSEHLDFALTPAQHFSGRSLLNGDSTLWGSWVIEHYNQSLFFSGDSGYMEEFKTIGDKYGPFDIAFLESGQYNEAWADIHMFPEQVVQAGIDLNASVILPIHNSKYTLALHSWDEPLERVSGEGERRNMSVATPMIGETFLLGGPIPNEAWWLNVSNGSPSFLESNSLVGYLLPPLAVVGIFWMITERNERSRTEEKNDLHNAPEEE